MLLLWVPDKPENKRFKKWQTICIDPTLVVRVIEKDGIPYWVASDVCRALGIVNISSALERIYKDSVGFADVTDSSGRLRETRVINESGLYALIMRSNKPEAERFQYWVTSEVLPSIRKTGGYTILPEEKTSAYKYYTRNRSQLKSIINQ